MPTKERRKKKKGCFNVREGAFHGSGNKKAIKVKETTPNCHMFAKPTPTNSCQK